MDLEIAYRTWVDSVPSPRKLQVEVPGWGGTRDMGMPQPWHCKPFLDGNSLGIELFWGLPATVVITGDGVDAQIEGDLEPITGTKDTISQFARGHYGINSNYHLRVPPGWGLLVLPHPRWSLDPYQSELPAIVPGLLESAWWPHLFFVVSRIPPAGVRHVFRYGEPFCQVLPVPLDVGVKLRRMDEAERAEAMANEAFCKDDYHTVSTHSWWSENQHHFGNIYKVLSRRFRRGDRIDWTAARADATLKHQVEDECAAAPTRPGPGPVCPMRGT